MEEKEEGIIAISSQGEFKVLPWPPAEAIGDESICEYSFGPLLASTFARTLPLSDGEDFEFAGCEHFCLLLVAPKNVATPCEEGKTYPVSANIIDGHVYEDERACKKVETFFDRYVQLSEKESELLFDHGCLSGISDMLLFNTVHARGDGIETPIRYSAFTAEDIAVWKRRFENEEEKEEVPVPKQTKRYREDDDDEDEEEPTKKKIRLE